MDKQQQIEEMAKFMHYKAHGKDKDCDNEKCEMCWCSCKNDAESLYNAGYRKIPEDSVVLSRKEQEKILTATEKRIKELKRQILQARKETAERDFCTIIKALEERKERVKAFYGVAESAGVDIAIRTVKELAKQLGVEIKE